MADGVSTAPGLRLRIQGTVQGVGMRPFVYRVARSLGLTGSVQNDARGVTILAYGPPEALERLLPRLRAEAPPAARLDAVESQPLAGLAPPDFTIAGSDAGGDRRVSIPPDLAPCPDCLRELSDPADRRHRYPFTNCTACGPRFTIARDVPYDRAATTMAPFRLCADCEREYRDPADRRFHAEPNACPRCGPHAWLSRPGGGEPGPPLDGEAVARAAAALREGRILALRGVGGFHLACDATSPAAVRALRERKRREEKPLAVMVADLGAAEALAFLSPEERALLAGPQRPIVLLRRRPGAGLAPEVAPGTPLLGLLLPCSPLHQLLLAEAGRPLVMTSGNLAEEPIAVGNAEALSRLGAIADLFLLHDREIETRADDSVARWMGDRPLLLRRSRGYVPGPLRLPHALRQPVLACGALLKNAFCLARGDQAFLGPHIGDLENLATMESFEGAVARMERFLRLAPEVLAHDLHPELLSTRYALDRARAQGVRAVAVQHHHAHVAAAMAERGLPGPVLGLAWDGTGLGTDGTAWGGELLHCTYRSSRRLATLRPLRLPGGDLAVRQPWRLALSLLTDALGPYLEGLDLGRLALFREVPAGEVAVVRRMLAAGVHSPPAHGAGRWFDAVGALALGRPRARYEGQVAMALDAAADDGPAEPWPFALDRRPAVPELDLRPMAQALLEELLAGAPAGRLSARFHATLAEGAAALVGLAAGTEGGLPVVLTGGVFQNARLSSAVTARLSGRHEVHGHSLVPAGDGGLALGQALVADAVLRG